MIIHFWVIHSRTSFPDGMLLVVVLHPGAQLLSCVLQCSHSPILQVVSQQLPTWIEYCWPHQTSQIALGLISVHVFFTSRLSTFFLHVYYMPLSSPFHWLTYHLNWRIHQIQTSVHIQKTLIHDRPGMYFARVFSSKLRQINDAFEAWVRSILQVSTCTIYTQK